VLPEDSLFRLPEDFPMDTRITGTLGDILLREGLITQEELRKAEAEHQATGKPLARVLVDMDVISEKVKLGILQKKTGTEITTLRNFRLDAQLAARIPKPLALRHAAVPIRVDPDGLVVAMDDPSDLEAVDKFSAVAGTKIKAVLAPYNEIEIVLTNYPEEEAPAEAEEARPRHPFLHFFRHLTFWVLLLTPLAVFFLTLIYSDDFQGWWSSLQLSVFDRALYFLLVWGTWSIIVYYIHDVVFSFLLRDELEASAGGRPE
jgi:hypothetical protein